MATNIYSPTQRRWLLVISIAVVGLLILYGIAPYLSAVLGSVILYVLFRPLFHYLTQKKAWPRVLTALLIIVGSFLIIVLPFLLLSALLVNKVTYYAQHTDQIMQVVRQLEDFTGISLESKDTLQLFIQRGSTLAEQWLPSLVGGTLDIIVIVALLYFVLYYMLVDEPQLIAGTHKYLPFDQETLRTLDQELKDITNANVVGQGLISLVQGGLTGVGLWLFGFADPLFWGTIAFFVSFIPVLGTPLVWGPAGILAIAQGNTGPGIGLLLFGGILVMNVDNVMRIVIGKRLGNVHPLITLGGVVLGIPLFGILGLVIGPLLIDYFITLLEVFARQNTAED